MVDAEQLGKDIAEIAKSFVATVAHDLKSPIGTIRMSADMMVEELTDGRNFDTLARYAEMIQRTSNSMLYLIDSLLDYDQIETGNMKLRKEAIDLRENIKEITTLFEPLYTKKGVSLKCELPEEPIIVTHDKLRFSQVLSNLLSNSLKFTEKGSVTLELINREKEVELVIKDTGVGIPEPELARVFQRYTRVDPRREGTGLGLFIAKWVVDAHNGSIWAKSDGNGKGTEFHVILPKVDVNAETREG